MINNNVQVVILAAGQGTRLRPITNDKPKCMVPFINKTLINHQLDILNRLNIHNVMIIAGYKSSTIEAKEYPIYLNPKFASTNMVYTLFCAETMIDTSKDILILYGDCIYEERVIRALLEERSDATISIDLNWKKYWGMRIENPLEDAETLKVDNNGNIIELGKKPISYDDIQGQYMGAIKFSKSRWLEVAKIYHQLPVEQLYDGKNFENMYMTSFLQLLIDSGITIKGTPVKGGWLEFDSVEDLNKYEELYKENKLDEFFKVSP